MEIGSSPLSSIFLCLENQCYFILLIGKYFHNLLLYCLLFNVNARITRLCIWFGDFAGFVLFKIIVSLSPMKTPLTWALIIGDIGPSKEGGSLFSSPPWLLCKECFSSLLSQEYFCFWDLTPLVLICLVQFPIFIMEQFILIKCQIKFTALQQNQSRSGMLNYQKPLITRFLAIV